MTENCSRCNEIIECKVNEIENCNCSKIELKRETIEFLKKTHYSCLCNNCLSQLDYFETLNEQYKHPTMPSEFIQHIHYYIENGYWVFTEFFHYQKGKCCENGCRHCAYGFKK
ncbi:cysteine-rich CWC family protein [Empedobacter brevis]|uniref:cysteine-rich CWC family protein n=1 Tax=Empedobacter brevis TaxID=247 RepID=UPI002899B543|nr:cysteine-rich CWC family protein [Empedobacter brevis]